jgi:protocatechuate 3,4-dioxygenase beta subunit
VTTAPTSASASVPTEAAASTVAATDTAATVDTAATADTAVSTVGSLATGTPSTTVFTAADFADLGTCVLLPDLTQGPYPTVTQIERRDITEGHEGHPLRVGVQIVDSSCAPIPGAVLEIWHCDVDGDYSAYSDGYTADDGGPGTTFFRGSQTANEEGIVEFLTSYPGWYTGRAVHIHAKVHIDDATVLTTQFFFDDAVNNEIFTTDAAYVEHGEPDTTNETDNIAGGDPEEQGTLLTVSDDAEISGSRALIVVGLDPTAT